MVVPIRKQMDDLGKKIQDMEKSVALIARHVKSELEDVKKAAPKTEIKELAEWKQYKERITGLEAAVRAITKHVKDELEAAKKDVKEAQLKLILDMKKLPVQKEETGKAQELERRLNEEIARLEGFIADSNKVLAEDVERKINEEVARLEDLLHDSGTLLTEKGMEDYVNKINKLKLSLERYVNVKAQLLETRINELVETIKGLEASRDYLQLDEKLAGFDARFSSELGDIKRTISALGTEEEIQSLRKNTHDTALKLSHFADEKEVGQFKHDVTEIKQSLSTLAPESELVGLENAVKSLRKKLDVFETADDFQKFRSEIEKHLAGEDAAIAEARDKQEENMKKLMLDFTLKINQMKKKVDEEAERFKDLVNEQELQDIRNDLEELHRTVDSESASRQSLEKNFGDLEHVIKRMNVQEEVQAIRLALEEETANRQSIEKNLADIEKTVTDIKERYAGVEKLEHLDFERVEQEIAAFRESLKGVERELHLKAMGLITQQLNEFARSMDRRIPDLMTKDEFLRSLTEIKAKLQTIEAPDMTPLALRVEQLEREVANIANMMHSVYNRLPIVVE